MSMEYIWKKGFRLTGDPSVVGNELSAIQEEHGSIAPEIVVEKAEPPASPLHQYFEWNDTDAAKAYRVDQARYLIRAVAVRIERDDDEPIVTRAFVEMKPPAEETTSDEPAGSYMSIEVVSQNDDMRKELVKQALHDIEVFRRKYAILTEVFDLLNSLEAELEALK